MEFQVELNRMIFAGAVLSGTLAFAHIVPGGAEVHIPVLNSDLAEILKGYVSVVWHMISVQLILSTILLFYASIVSVYRRLITSIIIAQYFLFALVFLFYNLSRFKALFEMPPWIGFVAISLLAALGLRIESRLKRRSQK